MNPITNQAIKILEQFPQIQKQPASISGKYHQGETVYEHLKKTAEFMKLMCEALNISAEDTDMLIACSYLHDLGTYIITSKGKVDLLGWKYYPKTKYSKLQSATSVHPLLSANILEDFDIERKEEIQEIVSAHMNHWYKNTPRAKTIYQRLLVIADYLATKYKI